MNSFVTIEIYHSPVDAAVARDLIEQAGIRAYLLDDHAVAAYGLLNSALGGVKLQVSAADEPAARKLLQEVQAKRKPVIDSAPVVFECTTCHGRLEFPGHRRGGVESCRHCGAYVDVPEQDEELPDRSNEAQSHPGSHAATTLVNVKRRIPLHLEILGVLSFVYIPHLISAMSASGGGTYSYVEFMQLFVGSLQSTMPLLLILVLLGEELPRFGLTKIRWTRNFLCGLGVAAVIGATSLVRSLVTAGSAEHMSNQFTELEVVPPPLLEPGGLTLAWCLISVVANSIAEELCMRGYLVTRLTDLWGNRALAVFLAAILFGSYHMYQGTQEAIWIAFEGIIFGYAFLWLKSIWPLVIAHTLINLYIFTAY